MLSGLFKSIPFLLALAGSALADTDITNMSSDGIGCTATIASSSTGFNAWLYSYPLNDYSALSSNDWIENSFKTLLLNTYTTGVTDPNFTFDSLQVTSASLYGISSINLESIGLRLMGFFVGMYISF
jgi:hypothetical protein